MKIDYRIYKEYRKVNPCDPASFILQQIKKFERENGKIISVYVNNDTNRLRVIYMQNQKREED